MALYRNLETQEEIDVQYNVEATVPNFMDYAKQYVAESERARNELECLLDVPFGPTVDETFDIFPSKDPHAPIMLFIHGGYWRILSSKEFSFAALALVESGVTVVVTNYSLCPKVSLPEITRQSRAAVASLYKSDLSFNGSRERIFVSGHSAGGHQTGMLLSTDWAGEYGLPSNIIKGGIPISGLFDLGPFYYSWLQPKLLLTHRVIANQSPLFHIPAQAPPMLISVGGAESDEFHRQSKDYCKAWNDAGLVASYSEQPGKNHFSAVDGFMDRNSTLCTQMLEFIEACEQ